MKIVFLADALDTQKAGIHQYCKGLLLALDELETKHQLCVVRPKAKNQFKNITEIEVPVNTKIPLHQRWRLFTSIPKIVNKLKPDAVVELAHFGPFNLPSNIKRVTFIHDISPVLYPQWHPKVSVLAHRFFLKSILKKTSLILTNTKFTQTEIIKKYPFAKHKTGVTHLGCAINEALLNPEVPVKTSSNQIPYYLYVGTLEPRKNINTLIKAFELFLSKQKTPNTNLILAGNWGWKYKSIEDAIKKSSYQKNIICKGYVSEEEKIKLIKNAVAFIYPSLYEGFGIPIIEAMRFGCPVICSNIGSSKEVAGNMAMYFEKLNAEELCGQMQKIKLNPLSKMQKKAFVDYSERFTWLATANKTLSFLEQL